MPGDLPEDVREAVGDGEVVRVAYGRRGVVTYDLHPRDGWPTRVLVVADAADPYAVIAEVDRLDWLADRLPVPRVLVSVPLSTGGHAAVLDLPAGHHGLDPEARADRERLAAATGRALAMVHRVDIGDCPFTSRIDVRLRAIRRRLNAGLYDRALFSAPYRRYDPAELFDLALGCRPEQEDLVFVHGRFGLEAVIVDERGPVGLRDWSAAGVADRHVDFAGAIGSVASHLGPEMVAVFEDAYLESVGRDRGEVGPHGPTLDFYAILDEFA